MTAKDAIKFLQEMIDGNNGMDLELFSHNGSVESMSMEMDTKDCPAHIWVQ